MRISWAFHLLKTTTKWKKLTTSCSSAPSPQACWWLRVVRPTNQRIAHEWLTHALQDTISHMLTLCWSPSGSLEGVLGVGPAVTLSLLYAHFGSFDPSVFWAHKHTLGNRSTTLTIFHCAVLWLSAFILFCNGPHHPSPELFNIPQLNSVSGNFLASAPVP